MKQQFSIDRIQNAIPDSPEVVAEMLIPFANNLEELQPSFHRDSDLDKLRLIAHSKNGCAAE